MQFGKSNFLSGAKGIVTGGGLNDNGDAVQSSGYLVDVDIPIGAFAGGDAPTRVTIDSLPVSAKTMNAAGDDTTIPFLIPRDYDEETDILVIAYTAQGNSGGSTTLTTTANRSRAGVVTAALTFTGVAAPVISGTTPTEHVYVFTGQGLERGDVIDLSLDTGTPSGSGVYLRSGRASYRSCLVSYNVFETDGVTSAR